MRGLRSRVPWDPRATMPFLPATSDSGYYGRTCPVTGKFAYPQRAENRKEGTPQELSSRADVSSRATARDLVCVSRGLTCHDGRRQDPSLTLGTTTASRGRSPLFRLVA